MATRSVRAEHAPVTMRVPFAASSVASARQQLKRWMGQHGSSREHIEDARVIISELVANSVRHAQPLPDGTILISWAVEHRGLKLSVTDGGSATRPRTVNASSSALAGRGMAIVESLAIAWWTEKTRSRSTVHAVLSVS
ncbi:MAG TPA: ATP-binding protein [Nocardioidaceae bacterium]|nr:ATP-binding protein [Nocardioidaceae bacterium]